MPEGTGEPATQATTRRHDLDALRAGAMLLGVLLHGALSFVEFPWPVQDTRQNGVFALFFFAVHGFRMPVFFLISGFFTAMLWRRRGLNSLLKQRFLRVFVPLLLGMVTIIPALNWCYSLAARETQTSPGGDTLWSAAKYGDEQEVLRHLAAGADVNAKDKGGIAPLHWAAGQGSAEVATLLLEEGADIEITDNEGSTPLHWAAFFGQPEVVEVLLDRGAETDTRNRSGSTPLDSVRGRWTREVDDITAFLVAILDLDVEVEDIKATRAEVRSLLGVPETPDLADRNREAKEDGDEGAELIEGAFALMFFYPFFHHLWFLWFLCWLVAGFAVYAGFCDALRLPKLPRWLVLSPVRWLWLLPLTLLPQALMRFGGEVPGFGPDTSAGILPMPHMLFYYGTFFWFGAQYFDAEDSEGRLGRWWFLSLPLGLLVIFPAALVVCLGGEQSLPESVRGLHRPLSMTLEVLYAWLVSFGLMGMCRALLSRERAWIRYLSDSSYWLYLAHLPLIILGQILVRDWPLPALVKFALVTGLVSALLLVVYDRGVRYTWLGRLLNGPRKRPAR